MAGFAINRNQDTCVGCNECVLVCPQSSEGEPKPVLQRKAPGEPPDVANADNCIQCFNCVEHCRSDAISFEGAHAVEILIRDDVMRAAVLKII